MKHVDGLLWILGKEALSPYGATMFDVTKEEVKANFFRVLMQYRAAIFS